ncbi:MAG TPA: SigB/SigF/SigG family RNA polymerase sigma factor [Acidimicrobiales bacterium]|nr:SigB/SigF/SigG family RNA polymerase sigma factor [Acidimicrobiales bacterium]
MGSTTTWPGEDEQSRFVELRGTGDPAVRRGLIEDCLPLARHVARWFTNRGEPLDDLTQVAALGLVKAVDRFDPDRNVEFSTFATHTMVGELKRHFRDKGWALRPPRSIQERYLRLNQAIATLSQQEGRSPTIAELATEVNSREEDVLVALDAAQAYRAASLDGPASYTEEDGQLSLSEHLGEEDPNFGTTEDWTSVAPVLRSLPERQRLILVLRFFEGLSQSAIAHRLGISQMHVSRLLARSLSDLRARVG